jgi:P2 family phage contractile tail tube protein
MANESLFIMEAANLFCGDGASGNHLSLVNLKLPGLELNFADHNAGGAPVGIEIDTHINKLESTFNLAGWKPDVMKLMGTWQDGLRHFTAYGAIRDRETGKLQKATAVMWGQLGRANPTEFSRGNVQAHEYSIRGITRYLLSMGDVSIYDWDFFANKRIVGGVDLNAELNSILSISSATDSPNAGLLSDGLTNV